MRPDTHFSQRTASVHRSASGARLSGAARLTLPLLALLTLALLTVACASSTPGRTITAAPRFVGPDGKPLESDPTGMARPEDRNGPVTHLGRQVLPRCDVVVRARTARLSPPLRGVETARTIVLETLYPLDFEVREQITLLARQPGLIPREGFEALLVLKLMPRTTNLEVLEVSPLDDEHAAARVETFRKYVEIEAIEAPAERLDALRSYLRTAVDSPSSWVRLNAAREYAALAGWWSAALEGEDTAGLDRVLRSTRSAEVRRLTRATLDRVGARTAPGMQREPAVDAVAEIEKRYDAPGSTTAARRDAVLEAAARWGKTAVPLLERAVRADEPAVREAAVVGLAEVDAQDHEPYLRRMLATEPEIIVRRSLIVSLGLLRSEQSVPQLAALARGEGRLAREACYALARIGTPAALERLRDLGGRGAPTERADLVDFLLSDAFEAQERALGREPHPAKEPVPQER